MIVALISISVSAAHIDTIDINLSQSGLLPISTCVANEPWVIVTQGAGLLFPLLLQTMGRIELLHYMTSLDKVPL